MWVYRVTVRWNNSVKFILTCSVLLILKPSRDTERRVKGGFNGWFGDISQNRLNCILPQVKGRISDWGWDWYSLRDKTISKMRHPWLGDTYDRIRRRCSFPPWCPPWWHSFGSRFRGSWMRVFSLIRCWKPYHSGRSSNRWRRSLYDEWLRNDFPNVLRVNRTFCTSSAVEDRFCGLPQHLDCYFHVPETNIFNGKWFFAATFLSLCGTRSDWCDARNRGKSWKGKWKCFFFYFKRLLLNDNKIPEK